MILLLRGGDELSFRRRLQALKDEADGGTGMLVTNLTQIEGKDARPEDILGAAMTPPFMAPNRLVIVNRFLDRFDRTPPQEKPGEDGEQPRERGLGQFEAFAAALEAGLPPTTVLVLSGGPVNRTNVMAERLKKSAGATEEIYTEPQKGDLLRFIRDEAAARGLRFRSARSSEQHWDSDDWVHKQEGDPVALLGSITQGSTLAISNELDKLALYTQGREATVDDVYELCSGDREITTFNMIDAVQDGKAGDALHYLSRLRENADVDQLLISMLSTRYKQTAVLVELMDNGASEDEVGRAMGNAGKYPGLRQAGMRRARRIGADRARAALAMIVDYDYRAKKNEIHHEVALELLVTNLAGLVNGSASWNRAPFALR